jgi:pyridoxamine 5'-phosphate oxidase
MQLDETDLTSNPFTLVARWYDEARAVLPEAQAMTLATSDELGPDLRTVYLRALSLTPPDEGLVFYTNYDSDKGRALAQRPNCSALLYWGPIEPPSHRPPFGARQVRVRGRAERVPAAVSDAYFKTRSRLAQLGAWASPQSEPIESRAVLDARVAAIEERFAETAEIPRPPHWGGYLLRADSVELWQARDGRLHDRFRYVRDGASWHAERLAP